MKPKDFNPDDILPGTVIGGFVVRGRLGRGGSSSVYEVESPDGHRFALKMCRYRGDAPLATQRRVDQRCSRSIACLQFLRGQRNVAVLHAHGRYPDALHGHQYLVLELVPGSLLITEWVRRESPSLRKLVGAFLELAELCGVMASKGICHRDMKPANILVTPDGTPKVIDFETATCPGAEPVTLAAASAEPRTGGWHCQEVRQAIVEEESKKRKQSKEAFGFSPWGDVLSLGIVIYECLTGKHPFDLPNGLRREEIATETPPLNAAVPPGLNKVVMKMLETRPKTGYRDGTEVAKDLRKLLKKARGKRWAEPFQQPVLDKMEAPALPLDSPFVSSEAPALDASTSNPIAASEKEGERPMPDTPSSVLPGADAGAPAEAGTGREAPSSQQSAKPERVPDGEKAPVLLLVSPSVPPQSPALDTSKPEPASASAKESGPMPGTPSSVPQSADTGPSAKVESGHEETSGSAKSEASPRSAGADTDEAVLLPNEWDTGEPRELPESEPVIGSVLKFGTADSYTLEELLGRGGYGDVYRARQEGAAGFVQQVAIKLLRPDSRPAQVRSFVNEARVLSRLHHENIARVHAFHEWQGSYVLVMEYVDGLSLHALLELARRKGHRFSVPVACAVMADVAKALDHAHQVRGEAGKALHIVHRDVSPTNILIAKTGRVVLLDFGVARFEGEGRTPTGSGSNPFKGFKGKVPYLSPEQVKGRPVDARSDLFSVGTILVEMLTGMAPFGTTTHYTTWKRIENVTPEFVASLLPGSRPLRALCQKLLARDPDQRFATAREAAMALCRHVRPHEGPESIRAVVEKLKALPDAHTPLAQEPAKVAVARALSRVRRSRRALAVASVFVFAALVVASWYAPRHAVPVPPSPLPPLLQRPAVSLPLPPERGMAPASPVSPPLDGALVGKPEKEGGADPAGPVRRRDFLAIPSSAPPVALASKRTRVSTEAIAPAVEVNLAEQDSTAVRRELALERGQVKTLRADKERCEKEETSVDYAIAALIVRGRSDLTPFVPVRQHSSKFRRAGVDIRVTPFMPKEGVDDPGKAVLVFEINNQGAESWELDDVRLLASSGDTRPFALRAVARVVDPGRTEAFAVVIDAQEFGPNRSAHLALEIWQRLAGGLPARQAVVDLVLVAGRIGP